MPKTEAELFYPSFINPFDMNENHEHIKKYDKYHLTAKFVLKFYNFSDRRKHARNIACGGTRTHISIALVAGVLSI